jgi:hypothetical protein
MVFTRVSDERKRKGKENCNALDTNPRHVMVIVEIERVQYGLGKSLIEPIGYGVESLHVTGRLTQGADQLRWDIMIIIKYR